MTNLAMDSQAAENLLAGTALFFSLVSIVLASLAFRRESRVEKSAAYLELETNSSEVFKYEAAHADLLAQLRLPDRPPSFRITTSTREACACADNLYFQSLNLFEVCARFRRQGVIEKEVFASWVAWFHELVEGWHFRESWPETRGNYTRDVRDIFDVGCEIFQSGLDQEARRRALYEAVADIMDCAVIRGWLDETAQIRRWAPPP